MPTSSAWAALCTTILSADTLPEFEGMLSSAADEAKLLARFQLEDGSPVRSIAVVGSSGNLLYHGLGASIDSHDIVIRVNDAITEGYERDVGHQRPNQIRLVWNGGLKSARDRGATPIVTVVTSVAPTLTLGLALARTLTLARIHKPNPRSVQYKFV